jgi:hypothetical protein
VVANDVFVRTPPGSALPIDVLASAKAPAGVPLHITSFTAQTAHRGTVTAGPTSTDPLTYTPGQGYHGPDSFSYTVADPSGDTATATVHVSVNTPPTFAGVSGSGINLSFPHGTPGPVVGGVTLADLENDPVTLTVGARPEHGTVVISGSGNNFTYHYLPTPADLYDPYSGLTRTIATLRGPDQFTLRASDGLDVTDTTVTIDVPDEAPLTDLDPRVKDDPLSPYYGVSRLLHDQFLVRSSTSLIDYERAVHFAAPGVLWNDWDPDGDPMTAILVRPPDHGGVDLEPDGSFTYTPERGYTGPDGFNYLISDGFNYSVKEGTVSLSL